ncbi:MAG: Inosine-5-monophosphate dehydrogenase [Pseudonocardiales bacterium]|nr:Inosine-5-monophosphate dehydrogenase [Pseudonocardiales bacterium]
MKISDILRHKGSAVVTIPPGSGMRGLLAELAAHGIGALIVADGGTVVGIVSERDIVRALNERGAAILDSSVDDIMTSTVLACRPDDSVDSVATTMTENRVRHMPVIDDDRLIGIVSIGDVVSSRMRQLEQDRGQLEHYITG